MDETAATLNPTEVDAAIAATLVPWANDISHGWLDDARPALTREQVDRYCDVFERIFREHHPSHLEAMKQTVGPPPAG